MTAGSFDHVFDRPGGKPFTIRRTPTDAHHTGTGTGVLNRAELERPSCPACYTPRLAAGYCTRCVEQGAAERHQANREAGW